MKVAIRADATHKIGFGHLVRCLTFGDHLRKMGHEVVLLSGGSDGFSYIQKNGIKHFPLHAPIGDSAADAEETINVLKNKNFFPDVLVLDHYYLNEDWEKKLRLHAKRIMVLEDVPNRPHHCDYLLIQNEIDAAKNAYTSLVNVECKMLLGPAFALLRPEFTEARAHVHPRDGIRNVLVFFGTTDVTRETSKVIRAVSDLKMPLTYHLVINSSHPDREDFEKLSQSDERFKVYVDTTQMAELMKNADLSLGAGGFSTFERFVLGLPTLAIAVADNQELILKRYEDAGLLKYLGRSSEVSEVQIRNAIESAVMDPAGMIDMGNKGMALTDGSGCEKVLGILEKDLKQ